MGIGEAFEFEKTGRIEPEPKREIYLVLAGSLANAQKWAKSKNLSTHPSHNNGWICAGTPENLRGISNMTAVIDNTFYDHPHWIEILEIVQSYVDCGKIKWST